MPLPYAACQFTLHNRPLQASQAGWHRDGFQSLRFRDGLICDRKPSIPFLSKEAKAGSEVVADAPEFGQALLF